MRSDIRPVRGGRAGARRTFLRRTSRGSPSVPASVRPGWCCDTTPFRSSRRIGRGGGARSHWCPQASDGFHSPRGWERRAALPKHVACPTLRDLPPCAASAKSPSASSSHAASSRGTRLRRRPPSPLPLRPSRTSPPAAEAKRVLRGRQGSGRGRPHSYPSSPRHRPACSSGRCEARADACAAREYPRPTARGALRRDRSGTLVEQRRCSARTPRRVVRTACCPGTADVVCEGVVRGARIGVRARLCCLRLLAVRCNVRSRSFQPVSVRCSLLQRFRRDS
jgi:hypothetical protein